MRHSIKTRIQSGMPCLAECGGFLYLLEELEDREGGPPDGRPPSWKEPLYGKALQVRLCHPDPGGGRGSCGIRRERGGSLCMGESIRDTSSTTWTQGTGEALLARKPVTGRSWTCGQMGEGFYAGFPTCICIPVWRWPEDLSERRKNMETRDSEIKIPERRTSPPPTGRLWRNAKAGGSPSPSLSSDLAPGGCRHADGGYDGHGGCVY